MAYLASAAAAAASSLRNPIYLAASSRRRTFLPAAVKATASSAHPILSSLRMAASAAVLLAATSPALACTPSAPPPPPTPLTATVSPDNAIPDGSDSESHHPFEKLIIETACLARIGGADEARSRLAAAGCGESYSRLLAAQALFVDGKVDEAIAAFEELAREDPADYRPLFCQGVLYLVLGREAESESMLERCREVGGDALIVDPAMMVTPTVEAESIEENQELEPEPAKV